MVDSQRMLFRGNIVPESQVQLVSVTHFPCNRGNGIVRFSICAGKDEGIFVGIRSPAVQYMGGKVDEPVLVFVTDTKH